MENEKEQFLEKILVKLLLTKQQLDNGQGYYNFTDSIFESVLRDVNSNIVNNISNSLEIKRVAKDVKEKIKMDIKNSPKIKEIVTKNIQKIKKDLKNNKIIIDVKISNNK